MSLGKAFMALKRSRERDFEEKVVMVEDERSGGTAV